MKMSIWVLPLCLICTSLFSQEEDKNNSPTHKWKIKLLIGNQFIAYEYNEDYSDGFTIVRTTNSLQMGQIIPSFSYQKKKWEHQIELNSLGFNRVNQTENIQNPDQGVDMYDGYESNTFNVRFSYSPTYNFSPFSNKAFVLGFGASISPFLQTQNSNAKSSLTIAPPNSTFFLLRTTLLPKLEYHFQKRWVMSLDTPIHLFNYSFLKTKDHIFPNTINRSYNTNFFLKEANVRFGIGYKI